MKTNHVLLAAAAVIGSGLLAAACTTDTTYEGDIDDPPVTNTAGGSDTTFDHDNNGYSPWDLIDRLATEGPPKYTSHVHSCSKVRYKTLGNILTSLGVNLAATGQVSAGKLYRDGDNAMGAPNFANRIRENIGVTTSGASREFDIFAAAAPEIIAAMPTLERCMVGGVGAQMFDGNACRAEGITCLIGTPATAAHIELCNIAITQSSTPEKGKNVAVASLLAASYTCE